MEELLPILEHEGVEMRIEPHPDDFVYEAIPTIQIIRASTVPWSDTSIALRTRSISVPPMPEIADYAGDLFQQGHIADGYDHNGSSGLRHALNPFGASARVHQHLDMGEGEIDWDEMGGILALPGSPSDDSHQQSVNSSSERGTLDQPSVVTWKTPRMPSPLIPGLHAVTYEPGSGWTTSERVSPGPMSSTSPTMVVPSSA